MARLAAPPLAGALFEPLTIGGLTIPRRVVKSATSESRPDEEGFPTRSMIDFYEPIARGGTPLLITGNMYVSQDGKATPLQLAIDDDG